MRIEDARFRGLARIAERLAEIQSRISITLPTIDFSALDRRVIELQDEARRIGEAGWTIPMWATPAEVDHILGQARIEGIDSVFLQYYEADDHVNYKHLKRDLLGAGRLTQWHALIEQCFTAFEAQLYLVVVPAMITVVEGAIAAAGPAESRKPKDPKQTASKLRAAAPRNSISHAIWISVETFAALLFEGKAFTGSKPLHINRHWILHGRDAPAWTSTDCLRLFQAVHTISV